MCKLKPVNLKHVTTNEMKSRRGTGGRWPDPSRGFRTMKDTF